MKLLGVKTHSRNLLMFFEKYQTFIVGIIGFGGVMLTIYMNARLSRNQHDHHINHEREALRSAISSELNLILKMLRNRCEMVGENEELGSAFYPDHISTQVYIQFTNKIGLLTQHEIETVMEAYALISDLPIRLQLLTKKHDPSYNRPGYIFIEAEHAKTAIGIHKSFIPKIEAAINVLKNNTKDL